MIRNTCGYVTEPTDCLPWAFSCLRAGHIVQSSQMRRLYLKDCVARDLVDDVYVVSNKQFAPTQTGKFFIKAFVSDRSAQVNARMWNATRDIFNAMPDSGFL